MEDSMLREEMYCGCLAAFRAIEMRKAVIHQIFLENGGSFGS